MNTSKKYPVVLLLAVFLLALLALLAALQYRWFSQLSRSDAIRMQADLEATASRFTRDVDSEIIRTHMSFLLPAFDDRADVARALSNRYKQWEATSLHPHLLQRIYWIETASSTPQLHRLYPNQGLLTPVEWPASLITWPGLNQDQPRLDTLSDPAPETSELISMVPFAGTAPVDSVNTPLPWARPDRSWMPRYQVLLAFDKAYLMETWLPTLADQHFLSDAGTDYDVLITERDDPSRILYRSSPTLTHTDFAPTDLSLNTGFPDWAFMMRAMTTLAKAGNLNSIQRMLRFLNPSTVDSPDSTGVALADLLSKRSESGMSSMMAPVRTWQLYVKPHRGSFESIVSTIRSRQLAVSFGVLLVLGTAIVLIIVYTGRMRRLADQQMAFVAGVSHDLRTPIAVMHAAGENMQDGLVTDPEETKDYGELIVEESQRLLNTVEQVLAYAGIAFGSERPPETTVAINEVIRHVLAGFGTKLDRYTVDLRLTESLPLVHGDREALATAIQNLIQNAQKYGGPKQWIGIETHASTPEHPEAIVVAVRDQGRGISASDQARIFEAFYRTEEAQHSQTRGNGLGLSIVKNIAEAHGGRVTVESVPNAGSTFRLFLPIASLPSA